MEPFRKIIQESIILESFNSVVFKYVDLQEKKIELFNKCLKDILFQQY